MGFVDTDWAFAVLVAVGDMVTGSTRGIGLGVVVVVVIAVMKLELSSMELEVELARGSSDVLSHQDQCTIR